LKKGDMAKEAERLLADTGWLPEPLRLGEDVIEAPAEGEGDDLPDFLADDDTETAGDEDQESTLQAAE
jgi:ParB family chromosome partitioning protein